MPSYADVESKMNEAIASIETGDYATAVNKAVVAQGLFAILPEGEKSGNAGERLEWNTDALDQFIANIRKQQTIAGNSKVPSGAIVNQNYHHKKTTCNTDVDCC